MKAYWTYTCDFGHSWSYLRDEADVETPQDAICPHNVPHNDPRIPSGREAVTLVKERLLDVVQVAIRPAARIVDPVKGQIGYEYDFYLVVTDLHEDMERQSSKSFTWSQAKDLMDSFRNLTAEEAWRVLDRLDSDPTQ